MEKKDIYKIALRFRRAIIAAKKERKFYHRDRMSNFPGGCCDDSSDLLAYYLLTEYNIPSRQRKGVYYTGDPNDTTNHAWLELDGELFVDITADQFDIFHTWLKGYMLAEIIHFTNILTGRNAMKIMIYHPMTACGRIIA